MFVKKSHPGSGMASHEILPLMPQAFHIAKQSFTCEAYFIQPRQRMDFIEKSTLARAFFLASLKGFEPPAYRLGGGRSIQLSYRDMDNIDSIPDFHLNCKPGAVCRGSFSLYSCLHCTGKSIIIISILSD